MSQPAIAPFSLHSHLQAQKLFSEETYGPGPRTAGVIAHIRKELEEIQADPNDLIEWIDVVLLSFDGAWRAGGSADELVELLAAESIFDASSDSFDLVAHIQSRSARGELHVADILEDIRVALTDLETKPGHLEGWLNVAMLAFDGGRTVGGSPAGLVAALQAKLLRNQKRVWPDWRTQPVDRPIEHDRSHDATEVDASPSHPSGLARGWLVEVEGRQGLQFIQNEADAASNPAAQPIWFGLEPPAHPIVNASALIESLRNDIFDAGLVSSEPGDYVELWSLVRSRIAEHVALTAVDDQKANDQLREALSLALQWVPITEPGVDADVDRIHALVQEATLDANPLRREATRLVRSSSRWWQRLLGQRV